MKFARRLDAVPPYLFAELERKVSEAERAGIDVISLGIGDPDLPTPPTVIEALAAAARDPRTHQYPTNHGTDEFRAAAVSFYRDRFGVELDPEGEVIPVLGGKEGVGHIALACLDPGDVCLSPDPGYPPYTSGPLFAGAQTEEGKIRLSFRNAQGMKASDGGKLKGFAIAGVLASPALALAQSDCPNRPIKLIVGFAPGLSIGLLPR